MFCHIFFPFLESTLNFPCCVETTTLIAQVFLKLLSPKDLLTSMHSKASFCKPFGSESVNESQKLLKSTEKYFYPTFLSF